MNMSMKVATHAACIVLAHVTQLLWHRLSQRDDTESIPYR